MGVDAAAAAAATVFHSYAPSKISVAAVADVCEFILALMGINTSSAI